MSRAICTFPIAVAFLCAAVASAEAPDWESLREAETALVVTADEDGESRETTVWLVVLDDAGIVRTGSSTWGENVVRKPELVLRVGEASYPLRVEFVEDDALRQRITDAFREKYGFSDRVATWIRGSHPKIMRLHPQE